ncbi:hypothetical protein EVAR_41924_1 [Eumeta japonica]|uniref:Uncharacterized protein n=1 Tax=Eumeta variegata TaxID=151549 RepID=A0A4C1XHG3_EUMVA|nr:hypothetical protein EVAR_41924_1 [Eumeta japonica]
MVLTICDILVNCARLCNRRGTVRSGARARHGRGGQLIACARRRHSRRPRQPHHERLLHGWLEAVPHGNLKGKPMSNSGRVMDETTTSDHDINEDE